MKLLNKREMASILDVSERTLTEWHRDGMPYLKATRGKSNHYEVPKVIAWMVAREVAKQPGQEGDKARLARLQGDMLEISLGEKRGELIPVAEIEPAWTALVVASRQSLLAMPARVAPLLASVDDVEQIRELLDEQVHDALNRLAPNDESGTDGNAAAGPKELGTAGADSAKRVGRTKSGVAGG